MEEVDILIEEAINPSYEDELRMSLMDDIIVENSIFKLNAMMTHLNDSPLRGDVGLKVAIERRINYVRSNK